MLDIIALILRKMGLRLEGRFGFELRISAGAFAKKSDCLSQDMTTLLPEPTQSLPSISAETAAQSEP